MDDPQRHADALARALLDELKPLVEEVRELKRAHVRTDGNGMTIPAWFAWLVGLTLPFVIGAVLAVYSLGNTNRSRLDVLETQSTGIDREMERRLLNLEQLHRPGNNDGGGP